MQRDFKARRKSGRELVRQLVERIDAERFGHDSYRGPGSLPGQLRPIFDANGKPIPRSSIVTEEEIEQLVREYHAEHGRPPASSSELIREVGHNWAGIDHALRYGRLGLPGGSSLPDLIARRCPEIAFRLSIRVVRAAVRAFFEEHGHMPTAASGLVDGKRYTWRLVSQALLARSNGLDTDAPMSLSEFKRRYCGDLVQDASRRRRRP